MPDDDSGELPFGLDDRQYRQVLEQALGTLRTGVVFWQDGRIVHASPTHLDLVGYSLYELRTLYSLEFVEEADREPLAARIEARRQGVFGPTTYDLRMRHKTGRVMELQVANVQLSQAPVSVVTLTRDVTEERELTRRTQQTHRMEALGHFCAEIVHDFNNYLTAVRLLAEALDEADADGRAPLVAELEKITAAAARLTHQLQMFAGGERAPSEALDMNIVVFEMAEMLRRVIGDDIELAVTLEPGLPLTRIDAAQIEQVLVNLVVNAREAIPHGGRVTVRTHTSGDYVVLEVADDGCGMPAEVLERALEPRFTTRPERATGMGLAIVYGIATRCSGAVDIASARGAGTRVQFRLPVVEAGALRRRAAPLQTEPRRECSVLLVEGGRVGDLTESGLTRCGFAVTRATLREAERHAADGAFDAVVVDTGLTGDPCELVARFRATSPGGAVVFTCDPPDAVEWDETVMRSVPKPFSVAEVAAAIRGG